MGVGATYAVMPAFDVGAELMLPQAFTGYEGNEPFDTRTLMIYGALRMK